MINHMKRLGIPCTQTLKLMLNLQLTVRKKDTVVASEKGKRCPHSHHMPYRSLLRHITDPLVDKGWNLHLKFGKGEPQMEQFVQGSSLWEPTAKTDK